MSTISRISSFKTEAGRARPAPQRLAEAGDSITLSAIRKSDLSNPRKPNSITSVSLSREPHPTESAAQNPTQPQSTAPSSHLAYETISDLEGGGDSHTDVPSSRRHQRGRETPLRQALFVPAATGVFVINIASSLTYAMVVNNPAPPQELLAMALLVLWLITTAVLVLYSVLYGKYPPKQYGLQVILLGGLTSLTVMSLLHALGAASAASGLPIGVSMAVVVFQIW